MSVALAVPRREDAPVADNIVAALQAAEPRSAPFTNWRMKDVLPEATAQVMAQMPFEPQDTGGVSGQRELHNASRRYLAGDLLQEPDAWAVASAFQSAAVVSALMTLTGVVLAGAYLRIEYALDTDGFWLEPHTDIRVKLLTLFLQLGKPGQETLGTDLYFDPDTWAERVPFDWNAAFLFVPSHRSWHGFAKRAIAGVRRSLIVNYVTEDWRSREQLAYPDRPVDAAA